MKPLRICLDTNVWIEAKEKMTGSEKAKKILKILTDFDSKHKLIIPVVLKLEFMYKLIVNKTKEHLIKEKGYNLCDLEGNTGKMLTFNTKLPQNKMKKLKNFFSELEDSGVVEITNHQIDFIKVEELITNNFELLDSLIIVQANYSEVDYFVTQDRIARKINDLNLNWLKIKATSIGGMLNILHKK